MTWIKAEFSKPAAVAVTDIEAVVENAADIGNNVVNALKNFIATPTGQSIEQIINNIPGVGPYVTDVLNFLPTIVVALGWTKAEFTKSPQQVVIDGVTAAVNAITPNVKATNLATLAAHVTDYVQVLSGAASNIQLALAAAPAVHANLPTEVEPTISNMPNSAPSNVVIPG